MAGYSPTPLFKKLGYTEAQAKWLIAPPLTLPEISEFAEVKVSTGAKISGGGRMFDLVHWFVKSRAELETGIAGVADAMRPDAMLWIAWPKKASKVPTDITEDVLREVILPTGLVDIKVCAVDEVWSGLKFMWRKELRSAL